MEALIQGQGEHFNVRTRKLFKRYISKYASRISQLLRSIRKRNSLRNILAIFLIALLLSIIFPSIESDANDHKMSYGTSCYNPYGSRGKQRSISYAISAVRKYFNAKGFNVKLVGHNKMHLKVDIYDDINLIDSVIVDIRSGKMRSIK